MIQLHGAYAGSGFGSGHLPFAGGAGEQPACVMASFGVIGGALARLDPPKKPEADR